jgi:hypothetical protein
MPVRLAPRTIIPISRLQCRKVSDPIPNLNRERQDEIEWSEGDERHGRLSREVAVEHRGSDRDTTRAVQAKAQKEVTPGNCLQPK